VIGFSLIRLNDKALQQFLLPSSKGVARYGPRLFRDKFRYRSDHGTTIKFKMFLFYRVIFQKCVIPACSPSRAAINIKRTEEIYNTNPYKKVIA